MQTETSQLLEQRPLGRTGRNVSIVGFGCAPIGSRRDLANQNVRCDLAREQGISYFDTADMYGMGGSEKTLCRVLGSERDKLVISTKCGFEFSAKLRAVAFVKPLLRPLVTRFKGVKSGAAAVMTSQRRQNFDPAYIERCVHGSLARLGTDRLDILYLHEPPEAAARRSDVFAKLAQLKQAGKIRDYGISAEPSVVAAALDVADSGISVIQVNVSLKDASALRTILPVCRQRGIGFVAGQPFANGTLFSNDQLLALLRQQQLATDAASISSLALRYVRAFEGVSAILASMVKPDHLKANVAGIKGPALSEAEWAVIAAMGAPRPEEGEADVR